MNRLFKTAVAFLLVLASVLPLCSCGIAGGPLDIGIVFPTKEEEWWLSLEKGFIKEIEAKGYNAEIMFSQGSSAVEKLNVDTLITRGIKVLIITPYDMDAAISTVEMAKSEGVDVICLDRLIPDTEYVDYYIAFENLQKGERNAQYLVDHVLLEGGKGHNLFLYSGALTDLNAYDYFRGYWNILQPYIADGTFIVRNSDAAVKYKDVPQLSIDQLYEIMLPLDTQWNPEKAKTLAEADLTNAKPEHKQRAYIVGPNDDTSRAIADAFLADSSVEYFRITGMDGTAVSVQYIIEGRQDLTVYGAPDILAATTMDVANDLLNGIRGTGNATTHNGVKEVQSYILDLISVTRDNLVEVFFDSNTYDIAEYKGYEDISDAVKPESFYDFLSK